MYVCHDVMYVCCILYIRIYLVSYIMYMNGPICLNVCMYVCMNVCHVCISFVPVGINLFMLLCSC